MAKTKAKKNLSSICLQRKKKILVQYTYNGKIKNKKIDINIS